MNWWKKILAVKVSLIVAILAVALTNSLNKIHERNLEVKYLKQQVEQSKKLAERFMGMEVKDLRVIKVSLTSYNPEKSQCDSTPLVGAANELIAPGQVAVSRDLIKKYGIKLGDKVAIEGYGVFQVMDTMHPRWKKKVDILSLNNNWSKEFGTKRGINLYFNKTNHNTKGEVNEQQT